MPTKKKIKAVLFDLDDTLVQTSKTRYAAVKHAGKLFFNLDISDDLIRSHWGKPFHEFVRGVYGEVDYEDAKKKYHSIIHLFPNEPYEDSSRVVSSLLSNYPVGVVSSAARGMVLDSLAVLKIPFEKYFHIQTADDTSVHKPDPAVFKLILKKLSQSGIEEAEILYVGDGPHDFHAATDAGLQFIGITGRTTHKKDFDALGAQTVTSLTELLELI